MKESDVIDKIANGGFNGLAACPKAVASWSWHTAGDKKILVMTFSFEREDVSEDD